MITTPSNDEAATGAEAALDASFLSWTSVAGVPDAQLFEVIRAEKVDVLVDLAGHTAGNRLPLFAARAAPLQITYMGYCNTTGLQAMDYIVGAEIYDHLEKVADRFDDVANEINSIVIEQV